MPAHGANDMSENPDKWSPPSQTREQRRLNDLAVQIAHAQLIQMILGQIVHNPDPAVTRQNIVNLEANAVARLTSLDYFPDVDARGKQALGEMAAAYASRLISGIQPDEG
jgi:hypothetical protein